MILTSSHDESGGGVWGSVLVDVLMELMLQMMFDVGEVGCRSNEERARGA